MRFIKKDRGIPLEIIGFYGVYVDDNFVEHIDYTHLQREQKIALKRQLLVEQNNLCAYCQQELTLGSTSIEHIICFSDSRNQYSLSYHNLLAVCINGGPNPHCDKARSRHNEYFAPIWFMEGCRTMSLLENGKNRFLDADKLPNTQNLEFSGIIIPRDGQNQYWKAEVGRLIDKLNLNHPNLVFARERAINQIIQEQGRDSWVGIFEDNLNLPNQSFYEYILICLRELAIAEYNAR